MIKTLRVILWDEEIGRLVWDAHRRLSYFTYSPEFVKKGLNVSPLLAPVGGGAVSMSVPIWGESDKLYQKLPAFISDSLPDAWGNQLFELWQSQHHISSADINPLDKLSFIGKRGMGALEFVPEVTQAKDVEKINLKSLYDLAERVFAEKENARILPEESLTVQSLLTVGTSAGGRQPKAIIAIDRNTGEIRSGQILNQERFDYYLLKFGNSEYSSAELEMTYYEMAKASGINMMPSELYAVESNNHFLTKRFDREGNKKIYTQTLAAICPGADSYEQLMTVCRRLHLPESDCQEVFRRMVFNVLSNNTDDHNKNFSFIMKEDGSWRLAPAYDITYVINRGGYLPNEEHCMFMRAKLRGFTRDDILDFARDNGIRRPDAVIRDVAMSLRRFRSIALKYGVANEWIGRVEATILGHLKSFGEWDEDCVKSSFSVNGHVIGDIRVEETYKGNYHLYANIDGKERKFVIGKNKEEHLLIKNEGLSNLTQEQLLALVNKYFKF